MVGRRVANGICSCGKPGRFKMNKGTRIRRHNECNACYRKRRRLLGRPILRGAASSRARTKYLKGVCESCGFVPEDPIQLHLDYIDGNRANNHPSNFQTLCANCHALKTKRNGDMLTPSRRPPPYIKVRGEWIKNKDYLDTPGGGPCICAPAHPSAAPALAIFE